MSGTCNTHGGAKRHAVYFNRKLEGKRPLGRSKYIFYDKTKWIKAIGYNN
jgi:hypothetical protein